MAYRAKDPRPADERIAELLEARLTYDAEPAGHSPQMWLEKERALSESERRIYQRQYREAKDLPVEAVLTVAERKAAREARAPKRVAWVVPSEDPDDDLIDLTHLT